MTTKMTITEIIVAHGNLFFWLLVVRFLKSAPFLPLVGMGALSFAFQSVLLPFFSMISFLFKHINSAFTFASTLTCANGFSCFCVPFIHNSYLPPEQLKF